MTWRMIKRTAPLLVSISTLAVLLLSCSPVPSTGGNASSYCETTAGVIGEMTPSRSREARQRIDAHLKKGGNVNDVIQPLFGTTFLHDASLSGDVKNVRYLLSLGAAVNAQDINGGTPIISAVAGCHLNVAALLVKYGANLELRDRTLGTAVELARRTKQSEMLRMLSQK